MKKRISKLSAVLITTVLVLGSIACSSIDEVSYHPIEENIGASATPTEAVETEDPGRPADHVEDDSAEWQYDSAGSTVAPDDREWVDTAYSSHILDAVYVGLGSEQDGPQVVFKFQPICLYRGELEEGDGGDYVYVHPWGNSGDLDEERFVAGRKYLLCLTVVKDVYYPHDYFLIRSYSKTVSEIDPDWDECHAYIETVTDMYPGSSYSRMNVPFSESDDIEEIIDFAECVFIVKTIEYIPTPSLSRPTRLYRCKVISKLKGKPNFEVIELTLPEEVSELGQEYVAIVLPVSNGSIAYQLAARKNALFTLEEARSIPQLKALLEEAEQ